MMLFGSGFIVTPNEALSLGLGKIQGLEKRIREYRNGKDLTNAPRGVFVIDLFGLTDDETRRLYPTVYQWLLERVKPERDANRDESIRRNWWLHGRTRSEFRPALNGLSRYIATVETSKHRVFQFLDKNILPDNKLVAIALSDAYCLGVLSSRTHVSWALSAGSWLGVGNDSVYVKTRCFETFPFPSDDTGLTSELQTQIAELAEQIDAHRKRQQAMYPELTLTGMYNVLERLRAGEPLTAKEKTIHEQGLVAVLHTLHDELDAAVLAAYGWGDLANTPTSDSQVITDAVLQRLVTLNAARAAEEAAGTIRWLRPAYQNAATTQLVTLPAQEQESMALENVSRPASAGVANATPWPKTLPDQVRAVSTALAGAPRGLSEVALAAQFKGKGQWKKDLQPILETLAALGRARNNGNVWHAG